MTPLIEAIPPLWSIINWETTTEEGCPALVLKHSYLSAVVTILVFPQYLEYQWGYLDINDEKWTGTASSLLDAIRLAEDDG